MNFDVLDLLYDIRSHAAQLLLITGPNASIVRAHASSIKKNSDYIITNLDNMFNEYRDQLNENNSRF